MIRDANDLPAGASLRANICIIGGGPAGITLALRLAESGLRVLLLESGGTAVSADTQALNAGDVMDPALHSPPDRYRQRVLGGGTTIWGGRCMPFNPIDFQTRPWIDHSGWPIGFAALEAHYPAANALCEAGDYEYDARLAVPGGMRPMVRGFSPHHFDLNQIERFSCPTDFARRYQRRLRDAASVSILLHATAIRLRSAPDGGRLERVEARTGNDRPFAVIADQFVLAMGGIETSRLLLTSNDVHSAGIGNTEDLVGRFYMCHIAGTVGALRFNTRHANIWHGYDLAPDGTYCRRRMWLRPAIQEAEQLANIIFRLHHPRIADPSHGSGPLSAIFLGQRFIRYEYARRLAGDTPAGLTTWLRHLRNAVIDSPATAAFLLHWLRHRTLAERKFPSVIVRPRKPLYSLDFHAEQVPNPESRIRLSTEPDRFGNRQVLIDWRYSRKDVETVAKSFALLQADLATQGIGTLSLAAHEADIETVIHRDGAYGGHHIGTTRMATGPRQGVVDTNCRIFGINNLFVAGSAIFPTSGQANPTLTIVALARRLADHLAANAARTPSLRTDLRPETTNSGSTPATTGKDATDSAPRPVPATEGLDHAIHKKQKRDA